MLFEMWGARWVARSLLLVMLATAFGPLAMASAPMSAAHCERRRVSEHAASHNSGSVMPCHSAMAASESESASIEPSEDSFHAVDGCCQNHDCCCASCSDGAKPVSGSLSLLRLVIEVRETAPRISFQSSDFAGRVSARAPPSC